MFTERENLRKYGTYESISKNRFLTTTTKKKLKF